MNGCSARPRRRGTVSGFLTAGGDYLEAVRSDLGLSLTPAEFAAACAKVVETYLDTLRGDIDWFCKKFDYRYDKEPWYDSKDAVERAIKFLRSDMHNNEDKKD